MIEKSRFWKQRKEYGELWESEGSIEDLSVMELFTFSWEQLCYNKILELDISIKLGESKTHL